MPSPFRVFRRHQKKLLAALGIMAIIAFCVPVGFISYIRSPSAAESVVVKTSKYGNLHERELRSLRQRRQKVLDFLRSVRQAVVVSGGTGQRALAIEQWMSWDPGSGQRMDPSGEQAVVDTWLYAQHAAQLGLVVDDKAVNDFIGEVTEDRLGSQQVKRIIRRLGVSQRQFFELLRHELLALRVQQMFGTTPAQQMFYVNLTGTTPAQRWDYYTRLKRLAAIEVVPVPVADYVAKVEDPGEKTLRELFERYKGNYPDPTAPDPGFCKPHRVAVRYFKAEYDQFMTPEAVTEDEIKKQYEENKDDYDRRYQENKDYYDRLYGGGEEEGEAEKPQGKPEGEADEPQTKPEGEADEPQTKPEGQADDQPAVTPPEDTSEKEKQPAENDPESAEEETESAEAAPAKEVEETDRPPVESHDSNDTSSATAAAPFMLVSLVQKENASEETAEPGAAAPESNHPAAEPEAPAAEPKKEGAEPAEPTGGPQPRTTEAGPAGKSADTGEEPAGELHEPVPEPPRKAANGQNGEPKDPLAGPLGEMIRRELARERAREKIDKVFGQLQGMMNRYRNEWIRYEVDVESGETAKKPEELDFEALAKANGLTTDHLRRCPDCGKIGSKRAGRCANCGRSLEKFQPPLVSQLEIREFDVGRSYVDMRTPFIAYAYEESWPEFLAATSFDLEGNRYLFWKVKDAKEGIPDFEDKGVRDQVLQAYKTVQARKLAIDAANQLRDKALEANKSKRESLSLKESLPKSDVTVTAPFSWMTYGNVPAGLSRTPPRLSEVAGVDMAGPDFMRTVFDLQEGEIGVAMNHPKTIAYVVRATEVKPPEDVLQAQFEVDHYSTYAAVAGDEQTQLIQAWQDELKSAAGLQWVARRPGQPPGQ